MAKWERLLDKVFAPETPQDVARAILEHPTPMGNHDKPRSMEDMLREFALEGDTEERAQLSRFISLLKILATGATLSTAQKAMLSQMPAFIESFAHSKMYFLDEQNEIIADPAKGRYEGELPLSDEAIITFAETCARETRTEILWLETIESLSCKLCRLCGVKPIELE